MKAHHNTNDAMSSARLSSEGPVDSSRRFWEQHYAAASGPSKGRPSAVLTQFAPAKAGTALDLGCARGNDAIWLARHNWRVTGVDVSATALRAARLAADLAGVAARISFVEHDLEETFPEGEFDLVTAMFLQSPIDFSRSTALRRAAGAVRRGGLFLIADHASHAPWSWAQPDTVYPTAAHVLADLALPGDEWRSVFVGQRAREAVGPNDLRATVLDAIVAIKRR